MFINQREFMFDTFEEANNIHRQLFAILRIKRYVTCADLFKLIYPSELYINDIYHTHGWTSLWDAKVVPGDNYINGDWILKMPKAKLINRKIVKEND